jgi:hypothetical protein
MYKGKTNISYEAYIKSNLEIISSQLSVKTYKLGTEDLPINPKGMDVRVVFVWTKGNEKKIITQFLVEKTFWIMKNTNDADREWMRRHADIWLNKFREMVNNVRKSAPKKKKAKSSAVKQKVGMTQTLFDENKKVKK